MSTQAERLAEFHALAGHQGDAAGCAECASTWERQQADARALRRHRAHAARRVRAETGR
jgi:hypothetical protein